MDGEEYFGDGNDGEVMDEDDEVQAEVADYDGAEEQAVDPLAEVQEEEDGEVMMTVMM